MMCSPCAERLDTVVVLNIQFAFWGIAAERRHRKAPSTEREGSQTYEMCALRADQWRRDGPLDSVLRL